MYTIIFLLKLGIFFNRYLDFILLFKRITVKTN